MSRASDAECFSLAFTSVDKSPSNSFLQYIVVLEPLNIVVLFETGRVLVTMSTRACKKCLVCERKIYGRDGNRAAGVTDCLCDAHEDVLWLQVAVHDVRGVGGPCRLGGEGARRVEERQKQRRRRKRW